MGKSLGICKVPVVAITTSPFDTEIKVPEPAVKQLYQQPVCYKADKFIKSAKVEQNPNVNRVSKFLNRMIKAAMKK